MLLILFLIFIHFEFKHFLFKFQILDVRMEIFVWLMEEPQEEEWKFVLRVYGVWYVTIPGM